MSDIKEWNIGNYIPLPSGQYMAVIEESCILPADSGYGGKCLQLIFRIIDGEHKDRKICMQYDIDHPINKYKERQKVAKICRAVNVFWPQDTRELHNIPHRITVTMESSEECDVPTNKVAAAMEEKIDKSMQGEQ